MDPQKFKKVEDIYHAALDVAPDKRDSFIKQSCDGDVELQKEVESLLSFEKPFDSIIDSPPESLAAQMIFSDRDADLIGKQINQYKITKLIGRGGMGEVYLALDTKLDRNVAIKFLAPEFANDAERLARFIQEAKAASALNHPNILTVYEIGETDGVEFIAAEFIDGTSLSRYLQNNEMSVSEVLDISTQIAAALSAAHAAGIVHRDIKPDNVMIRKDGIVKVLDFGLAKLTTIKENEGVDSEAATRAKVMTIPGMVYGTPQYMSPEQARGMTVDSRSDIFSLGIMLYEMISGKPPFSGVNELDTIGSILKDDPLPLHESIPGITQELDRIVSKSLRKDRERRYQHIKDLLIDLSDVKKTLELDPRPIQKTGVYEAQHTNEMPRQNTMSNATGVVTLRRFSLLHVLGFLLIAGFVIFGGWWFFLRGSAEKTISGLKSVEVATWASKPGETTTRAAFSADGKMVAFTSTKSGTRNVWVKQSATGEPIQVTKDEFRNENPIWSPDGQELAYYSERGSEPGIWRIPALGGTPKRITGLENSGSRLKYWGKSGSIYFEAKRQLFSVNSETGETKSLGELTSGDEDISSIAISRDEQKIAYVSNDGDKWGLLVKGLSGGSTQEIVNTNSEIKSVVWHPDSKRILYSSLVDTSFQIFVADVSGSAQPRQATFIDQDSVVLDISDDGKRVLYGSAKEESDIWRVNLSDKKQTAITSDIASEMWPDVSPDGKSILYQSIKNLNQGNKLFSGAIMRKGIGEGEEPLQIIENAGLPKWSPDGSRIAFVSLSGVQRRIETVNSTGGDRKLLVGEGFAAISYFVLPYHRHYSSEFQWSPDSKRIVYVSNTEGISNLALANMIVQGNTILTDTQSSDIDLRCPIWSPDGKSIAFVSKKEVDGKKAEYSLSQIDVDTKLVKENRTESGHTGLLGWGGDVNELIYAHVAEAPFENLHKEVAIYKLNSATGKTSLIVKLSDTYWFNIHLSPDRKTIAYTSNQNKKDDLWIVSVQGGEPKKITDNSDPRFYFSSMAWAPDGSTIYYGKQSRYSLLSMLTNFE